MSLFGTVSLASALTLIVMIVYFRFLNISDTMDGSEDAPEDQKEKRIKFNDVVEVKKDERRFVVF